MIRSSNFSITLYVIRLLQLDWLDHPLAHTTRSNFQLASTLKPHQPVSRVESHLASIYCKYTRRKLATLLNHTSLVHTVLVHSNYSTQHHPSTFPFSLPFPSSHLPFPTPIFSTPPPPHPLSSFGMTVACIGQPRGLTKFHILVSVDQDNQYRSKSAGHPPRPPMAAQSATAQPRIWRTVPLT